MNILDRYVLGRFLQTLPLCMAAAIGLFLLVDFFGRIGDLAEASSSVGKVVSYFVFKLPRILTEVYPAASLVAVLIGIGALAERREVLAMTSCGVAGTRILLPLALAGATLSAAVLGWNETVVPPTSSRARVILDVGIAKKLQTGVFNATSIWFQNSQGYVNVDYFDATHNILYGITLHEMDEAFRPKRIVKISRAVWNGRFWDLRSGTVATFVDGGDVVIRDATADDLRLEATPDELRRKRRRSYEFSYTQLRDQIMSLERKGLDATEYVVDMHYKIAAPFAGLVTIILGFPLAVRAGRRGGGILSNVSIGLAVSFAYWSVTALSVSAGHTGALPPLLAAWAPNAVFGVGGAALYLGRDV